MIQLNKDYWPGMTYFEGLIVEKNFQGKGLGSYLQRVAEKKTNTHVLGLDRINSFLMMLKAGRKPVAFLPEREFFGIEKESLLVTYLKKSSDFSDENFFKIRRKENDKSISFPDVQMLIKKVSEVSYV